MSLGADHTSPSPACPYRYPRAFVTPCEFESDFKLVSRALRGIAIRIVVGPDPYYILARTTVPFTYPQRLAGRNEIDARKRK